MKPFVPGAPGRGGASAHQRVLAAGGPDVDAVQGARREDHDVAGRQREAAAIAEALALACRRARLRTWVSCRADQPHRRSRAARSGCEHAQSESLVISGGGSVACEATLHHTQCLYQHVFFWLHHILQRVPGCVGGDCSAPARMKKSSCAEGCECGVVRWPASKISTPKVNGTCDGAPPRWAFLPRPSPRSAGASQHFSHAAPDK